MTSTIHAQGTAPGDLRTGPLTVPLQIIRAAGARHRAAVSEERTLPGWAILATVCTAAALIAFAVLAWRDVASPLLIGISLLAPLVAVTPDVLAALPVREDEVGA